MSHGNNTTMDTDLRTLIHVVSQADEAIDYLDTATDSLRSIERQGGTLDRICEQQCAAEVRECREQCCHLMVRLGELVDNLFRQRFEGAAPRANDKPSATRRHIAA